MRVLVIDNYDSFTYNLVQVIGTFTNDIIVKRNDKATIDELRKLNPDRVLISPGPGRPEDSNVSLQAIRELGNDIPVLGVCLGHQAIGFVFGAKIVRADELMHGKTSAIYHDGKGIFRNVSAGCVATRYHSLVIEKSSLPEELKVTAETKDGVIMGVRHKSLPIEGVQFHPESFLTTEGVTMIKNWLEVT